ncbi:MAG: C39 family peptidase [Acidobacteriota bacterium]
MLNQSPQLNLCWAATAASAVNYLDTATHLKKCEVAQDRRPPPAAVDCCATLDQCDVVGSVSQSLHNRRRFRRMDQGKPPIQTIKDEIDNDKPVCVRIQWLNIPVGGEPQGHFVAITGYSGGPGSEKIQVKDPLFTDRSIDFDSFPAQYEEGADWTHTIFTK